MKTERTKNVCVRINQFTIMYLLLFISRLFVYHCSCVKICKYELICKNDLWPFHLINFSSSIILLHPTLTR